MTDIELRPPTDDDAAAVVELVNQTQPERVDEAWLRRFWTAPGFDLDDNARVAVDGAGCVIGYADVEDFSHTGEKFWIGLHGDAADVLPWAESRVHELAVDPPRVFAGATPGDEQIRRPLSERAFRRVRSSYRMAIDVDAELEEPSWPPGVGFRTFEPGDARAVYEAHMETFEDSWEFVREPYEQWAHYGLERDDFDPSLWFLAVDGDELAGIALCRPDGVDQKLGWVGILGVRRPWRRRGLARALLLHSFQEFRRRGYSRVVLGVDAESLTGAHRLYESAGMHVVSTFDIYEKSP